MANSDLSTDLGFGILAPASSVPAVHGQARDRDSEGRSRRRPPSEPEGDELNLVSDLAGGPTHELDRLA